MPKNASDWFLRSESAWEKTWGDPEWNTGGENHILRESNIHCEALNFVFWSVRTLTEGQVTVPGIWIGFSMPWGKVLLSVRP